jgi:hypothetical protein
VEIRTGIQLNPQIAVKCGVRIFEVGFVLANLGRWVKHVAKAASDPRRHLVASASVLAFIPLFQFHNDGVLAAQVISARDQAVEPSRASHRCLCFVRDQVSAAYRASRRRGARTHGDFFRASHQHS